MSGTRTNRATQLQVDQTLLDFIEQELLPSAGLEASTFWPGLEGLFADFGPQNQELLNERTRLQTLIDRWHSDHPGIDWDADRYEAYLREIGYLVDAGEPFRIDTEGADPEIGVIAGPQLVVPVSNARFALNAANARWGSLYDALYGSDVIPERDGCERGRGYNPRRGAAVVEWANGFLDRALPLREARHAEVRRWALEEDAEGVRCRAALADGKSTGPVDPEAFVGHAAGATWQAFLFRHHGLHIEIRTDPQHPVGAASPAQVSDVLLESAVTTIQDCEDSVAAVDADDKTRVYRHWLGLMQGTLEAHFEKGGRRRSRSLAPDRVYRSVTGEPLVLPGRSLMLVRNVGLLMRTDAILDGHDEPVFEGQLDAVLTTAAALANRRQDERLPNSRHGSIYIVKPKLHGPKEAAFTDRLFARVEDLLGLERNTIKVGIMDEERRTTVNLPECIRAVRERLVFINTGFLDRTGDEIHTSMLAGPVLRKADIKAQPWIAAYEDWNVDVGLACGLPGRAQIGKGMWAQPDEMKRMLETKQAHPEAGASCAWVPSPTAATLHATHYHAVDVSARQHELARRPPASLHEILTPPLADGAGLGPADVQRELDNNAQGILGYVVRWIDHGIGCSKVPDLDDVGLMEDRATLRISSQHMANWLHHGITNHEQVMDTMRRMAAVVDRQNADVPDYEPMCADLDSSIAFQAACDLVLLGAEQPNGYTEPLLHRHRRARKAVDSI